MKLAEAIRQRVAAEAPGSFEVGRTLHSKTFDIGGGRRRVIQRMAPLHWRANLADGTETWKEIDLTITQGAGGQYRVVSGFYAVLIDPAQVSYRYATNRASGVTVVTLAEVGGAAPDYRAMTVEVAGNRFTWRDVAPGVDMYLVCRPCYAELFKVVRDAGAARSFGWQVTEDNDDDPKRAARFVRETAGWDADRAPLEMTTAVSNQRVLAGGRRRFLYRETWTGRVSRVTDRATRQRGWFDDPAYPAIIDATVTENIGAGADDGDEISGTWFGAFSAADIGRGYGGAAQHGGFRFQTVDVPQGASVSSATLTIRVISMFGTPTVSIYADDVDDAPAWGASSRPSSGFTKTTAKTDITSAIGTGLEAIDVTAIVQEIVDRAGWTNNNDIRFGAFNTKASGSHQDFYVETYENVGTDEAQLDITYTGGGGGGTTATPGVLASTTTTFAPTVTATNHKTATPAVLSAATAAFAPTVTATANRVATAGVAALGLTGYAPTVTVSDHKTATPAVAALVASLFAPVPAATAHVTATPGATSLSTATFAPTVSASDHKTATPGVTSLSTATFAPAVTAPDPKVAVPGVVSLTSAPFAPSVTASDHQSATPGVASLTASGFAPAVAFTAHVTATPGVASLTASAFAPVAAASGNQVATPGVIALATATFAPAVTAPNPRTATPAAAALTMAALAPTVTATDPKTATPAAAALVTATFAPGVAATAHITATPSLASLSLTGPAPDVTATAHAVVTVALLALSLSRFAPEVSGGAGESPHVVAGSGSYVPRAEVSGSWTPVVSSRGGV